jgi:adenylate kinase family enzyme
MKKILVIGSSGAGKSTFARRLGAATGIEVIHLDQIHWKPNWTEPAKEEWRATVENALRGDSWIMDGNFGGTMEMRVAASDTVIFLDLPPLVCIYRILKRVIFYYGKNRPDMAEGCNEKFDWKFIKWVWNYPAQTKPKVEALLKQFQNEKTIIRLTSSSEVENFFARRSFNKIKSF